MIPNIIYKHGKHNTLEFNEILKNVQKYKNKKRIILFRDPRDVYVSYYFQRTKRKILNWYTKVDWGKVTIEELMYDKVFGINRIVEYRER